jgi:mRNA-degrading endonuclease toxin of MazEF toxin-antitoxin module
LSKKYDELDELNAKSREVLKISSERVINRIKITDFVKFKAYMESISLGLKITYESDQHQKQRVKIGKEKGQHPLKPIKGQIYNALLGENFGSELSGQHPVIVIQNSSGNLFAQKVIVVPIEGDGNVIDESYMMKITDDDLEDNDKLTKNPSRIIVSEIITIDKARLGVKVGKLKSETIRLLNKKLYSQLSLDKD